MAKTKTKTDFIKTFNIADNITHFVNKVFGRRLGLLGPSRSLREAVQKALEDGYTEDELRMAFWVARCVAGDNWIGSQLQANMQPEIVLRHCGGMNKETGKPAARWLDNLIEKAGEINKPLVNATLAILPDDMRLREEELLKRVGVL